MASTKTKANAKARIARREPLDAARIVEAALRVIDEFGVDGLTMRRLGSALHVDPMAIYWHFADKAALLDAVVEHEAQRLREMHVPLRGDAIDVLVALAAHYRRVLLSHPNLAPMLASRPLPQEDAPALLRAGVELLRRAGIADADVPAALEAFVLFGFGYVLQEIGIERQRAAMGSSFAAQQKALLRLVRSSSSSWDSSLEEAVIEHRLRAGSRDDDFERGLRAMLHGLRLGLG